MQGVGNFELALAFVREVPKHTTPAAALPHKAFIERGDDLYILLHDHCPKFQATLLHAVAIARYHQAKFCRVFFVSSLLCDF